MLRRFTKNSKSLLSCRMSVQPFLGSFIADIPFDLLVAEEPREYDLEVRSGSSVYSQLLLAGLSGTYR